MATLRLCLIDFPAMQGNSKVQGGRKVPKSVVPACHLDADEGCRGRLGSAFVWDLPG